MPQYRHKLTGVIIVWTLAPMMLQNYKVQGQGFEVIEIGKEKQTGNRIISDITADYIFDE